MQHSNKVQKICGHFYVEIDMGNWIRIIVELDIVFTELLLYTLLVLSLNKILHCILKWISTQGYNHFRIIFRFFNVLPNFPFTTSETMRNYYL